MWKLILVLLFPTLACAFGPHRVALDVVTQSTILDGDATAIVAGCGSQPTVGFAYCRFQEGESADKNITFIAPPAQCNQKESCAFLKVWDSQSRLVWGGAIPKNQTRVDVNWKTLLSGDFFHVNERGLWSWNLQVFYVDPDGKERNSTAQGDIVLRVYRAGYLPLENSKSDPSFAWTWQDNGFLFRMTSGLRAYVGKVEIK